MSVVLQILGALAVLAAFVLVQQAAIEPKSYASLILNFVGSGVLAWLALLGHQWGFLLLEATWALASAAGLYARLRGHTRSRQGAQLRL